MKPHEQRVVEELKELSDKRKNLVTFIETNPAFAKLPSEEERRMRRQVDIMMQYEAVLKERIDDFPA